MIRRARVRIRQTNILEDPKPQFVSVVTQGANMTPFKVVRHEGNDQMKATRQPGYEVGAVEFSGEAFVDNIEAAKAWLEAGGYAPESYELVELPTGAFRATSTVVSKDASLEAVDTGTDGITIFVADETAGVDVAKEPEAVLPQDTGAVVVSIEPADAVAEKAADEVQHVAPAAAEVDVSKGSDTVMSLFDVIDYMNYLNAVVVSEGYGKPVEDDMRAAVASMISALSRIVKDDLQALSDAVAMKMAEGDTTDAQVDSHVDVPVDAPVEDASEEIVQAENDAEVEKNETPAITMSDVMAAIAALANATTQAIEGVKAEVVEIKQSAAEVDSRVEAIPSQTRKSADVQEAVKQQPNPDREKAESFRLRGVLGIRQR